MGNVIAEGRAGTRADTSPLAEWKAQRQMEVGTCTCTHRGSCREQKNNLKRERRNNCEKKTTGR